MTTYKSTTVFAPGMQVVFSEDSKQEFREFVAGLEEKHGTGPFSVVEVGPGVNGNNYHPQTITVETRLGRNRFSGFYFSVAA